MKSCLNKKIVHFHCLLYSILYFRHLPTTQCLWFCLTGFSLYVIMLLNVQVNSKAHVRMHTCDIFLSMCLFYVFVRHVAEKKQQRYFGERMGKQTAAHTQSFRNCVFQNLTFLKHLKKNITITSFSICNPKVLKRAAKKKGKENRSTNKKKENQWVIPLYGRH